MSSQADDDRSVAGEIARALAQRIVSGDLEPNDRLRQDHIALEFNVSHVPVREAFRRLEAQGLVVNEPRRGARVAALEAEQVMEVAEMRASLEVLALRHAMPRIVLADLAAARSTLEVSARTHDVNELEAANRAFHLALTSPCRMPRLLASIADLQQASARHLFATWRILKYQLRSDEEHLAILNAVQNNDAVTACSRLSDHIVQAGQELARAIRQPTRSRKA
jgi:DNA-binding GntR family transcriptional regulator